MHGGGCGGLAPSRGAAEDEEGAGAGTGTGTGADAPSESLPNLVHLAWTLKTAPVSAVVDMGAIADMGATVLLQLLDSTITAAASPTRKVQLGFRSKTMLPPLARCN